MSRRALRATRAYTATLFGYQVMRHPPRIGFGDGTGGSGSVAYLLAVRQLTPNSRARSEIDHPWRCSACSSIQVSSDCKASLLSVALGSATRA